MQRFIMCYWLFEHHSRCSLVIRSLFDKCYWTCSCSHDSIPLMLLLFHRPWDPLTFSKLVLYSTCLWFESSIVASLTFWFPYKCTTIPFKLPLLLSHFSHTFSPPPPGLFLVHFSKLSTNAAAVFYICSWLSVTDMQIAFQTKSREEMDSYIHSRQT